jgi:anti-sigma B factor antagonist
MEQDESKLFVQHVEGVTIVTFHDEGILEETCIKGLDKSLMAIVEEAKRQSLLLDFSNVRFMSSAFLGLLVKIHRGVCEKDGRLMLKNIDPNIYKVFEITQLTKVFDIS